MFVQVYRSNVLVRLHNVYQLTAAIDRSLNLAMPTTSFIVIKITLEELTNHLIGGTSLEIVGGGYGP